MPPETCPNCGADVPLRAKACPECGADEKTGWSEAARSDALGLPDDSFDYNEFVQREFGGKRGGRGNPTRLKFMWKIVAALLVIGFVGFIVRHWLKQR